MILGLMQNLHDKLPRGYEKYSKIIKFSIYRCDFDKHSININSIFYNKLTF